ncbi:ABC transporter permease [Paenibacillus sp. CAA11]|uniref:ABC transporter permease n=1 Tax=Paenibacillus sp. CAA11 TaxID=1532905 RepID=UPI000D3C04FC|nr:ABC transporter permease [Paenibacillus sp. CAA11]AWB46472.1 ABC transporter permease [Paenibacillus sp. CAA11]
MIKTNNRKAIFRLAGKSLKAGRLRSVMIICAVVLTTLLITSVFTMALSINKSMEYAQMKTIGSDFHGAYKYLSPSEVEKLKKHPSIREYGVSTMVGRVHDGKFKHQPMEVLHVDENQAKHSFVHFIQGGLPKAENEVVLSTWVLDKLGVQAKLGEPVKLNVDTDEQVISYEFVLSGYYESDENLSMSGLAYVSEPFAKKYISHIDPAVSKAQNSYVNTSQLSVMLDSPLHIEEKLNKILTDTELKAEIGVNWAYTANKFSDRLLDLLPYMAIILIIMLSGYLLIYNIFYISVVRDVKFYGLLKTIGTTPRQLRRIIMIQARLLYAVGLPVGLLLGYAIGRWITPMINDGFLGGSAEPVYSVSPLIFIGAALFSYLTVWIAARKPGRIAGRIAPVEAVKFAGVQGGKKRAKRSEHGAKLYRMSLVNLLRSKKKLVLMLSSLSLSIILFTLIYTVISSLNVNKYLNSYIAGDFLIKNNSVVLEQGERAGDPRQLSETFTDQLSEIDGVRSVDNVYFKPTIYPMDEKVRAALKPLEAEINSLNDPYMKEFLAKGKVDVDLYGIDPGWYEMLQPDDIVEGSFDKQKFASGRYVLIAESLLGKEDQYTRYYHPGDKITYPFLGTSYEVMAVVKYNAFYAATTHRFSATGYNAFLPASELRQNPSLSGDQAPWILSSTIQADPAKLDAVNQKLRSVTHGIDDWTLKSREEYREELGGFIRIFQTVGYGLSLVIALIGVLNYINTVLTGVISRRSEFSILESIGMTKAQLKRMLVYEGLYNVLFTMLIVSTLGVLITYSIAKMLAENMAFTVFHMSAIPFVAVIPVLIIIAYVVTTGAYRMLTKSTIVERLREVE